MASAFVRKVAQAELDRSITKFIQFLQELSHPVPYIYTRGYTKEKSAASLSLITAIVFLESALYNDDEVKAAVAVYSNGAEVW